jgi:hypothetical protein
MRENGRRFNTSRMLSKGLYKVGQHSIIWDGGDDLGAIVGSGVYIYFMRTGTRIEARKMVRLP